MLFGHDRAPLMDTGSRNGNLVPALQHTIKSWLARNNRASIPLIVAHTHEHEDHTFGDAAIQAMHNPAIPVTFIPSEPLRPLNQDSPTGSFQYPRLPITPG